MADPVKPAVTPAPKVVAPAPKAAPVVAPSGAKAPQQQPQHTQPHEHHVNPVTHGKLVNPDPSAPATHTDIHTRVERYVPPRQVR